MPEAVLPLTEAALYLALAPKSNSALTTYGKAREAVTRTGNLPVPLHLRNAVSGLMRSMGYGREYRYPHDHTGGKTDQDYPPPELTRPHFYQPRARGPKTQTSPPTHRCRPSAD